MTIEIPLNRNKIALIDVEDSHLLEWTWTYNPSGGGYASRTDRSGDKQKTVLLHREITNAKKGEQVDHINRNRLDNRRSNLRICTPLENARNAGKRKDGITSKFKGVYFKEDNCKFTSLIQVEGTRIHLGYYTNELDAAYYYNEKATEYFGEFAVLNDLPVDYTPTTNYAPENARGGYSKYRGVTYSIRDRMFISKIQHQGKTINIGSFLTDRIAAEMYNVYAIDLHGDKAILNSFETLEGIIA